MSIFSNIFKNSNSAEQNTSKQLDWKQLKTLSEIDEIIKNSETKPQVIFKHSTTCGISRMVLKSLERDYDIDSDVLDFYYLDLKAFREISNTVAEKFQVWHESPQIIIINNGVATYNNSHGGVTIEAIKANI